tara:strand:+ start:1211 stop:1690 length:480 start_codon:yes stop_codon:yes gene_type:complete
MKYKKEIVVIVAFSVLFSFLRYIFLDDFDLIKKKRVIESIDIYDMPDLLTEPKQIDTKAAYYLFVNKKTIFIDAREEEEYNNGHISGAINIPYEYYEDFQSIIDELDPTSVYTIYCSGGECSLSIDLADYLFYELAFENILIYEQGFPAWLKEGYPIDE